MDTTWVTNTPTNLNWGGLATEITRETALHRVTRFEVQAQRLLNKSGVRDFLAADQGSYSVSMNQQTDGTWTLDTEAGPPTPEDPLESLTSVLRQSYSKTDPFSIGNVGEVYA